MHSVTHGEITHCTPVHTALSSMHSVTYGTLHIAPRYTQHSTACIMWHKGHHTLHPSTFHNMHYVMHGTSHIWPQWTEYSVAYILWHCTFDPSTLNIPQHASCDAWGTSDCDLCTQHSKASSYFTWGTHIVPLSHCSPQHAFMTHGTPHIKPQYILYTPQHCIMLPVTLSTHFNRISYTNHIIPRAIVHRISRLALVRWHTCIRSAAMFFSGFLMLINNKFQPWHIMRILLLKWRQFQNLNLKEAEEVRGMNGGFLQHTLGPLSSCPSENKQA